MSHGPGSGDKCQMSGTGQVTVVTIFIRMLWITWFEEYWLHFTSAGSHVHVFKLSDKFATDDKNIDGQCKDICQDIFVMDINDWFL